MPKVLLLCHGRLAAELTNTAAMILGESGGDLQCRDLLPGQDMDLYYAQIVAFIRSSREKGGTLVLTDIMGGSPFINATRAYAETGGEIGVEIVTGVNLPMLIEVASRMASENLEELKSIALLEGASGIKDFSASLKKLYDEGR